MSVILTRASVYDLTAPRLLQSAWIFLMTFFGTYFNSAASQLESQNPRYHPGAILRADNPSVIVIHLSRLSHCRNHPGHRSGFFFSHFHLLVDSYSGFTAKAKPDTVERSIFLDSQVLPVYKLSLASSLPLPCHLHITIRYPGRIL